MPIFARTDTPLECECEHCSFVFTPPESNAAIVVRCPRCWRPVTAQEPSEPPSIVFKAVDSDTAEFDAWTSDTAIRSNDVLEELVQSLEAENQLLEEDFEITDEELDQLTPQDLEALGFGHLVHAGTAQTQTQVRPVRRRVKQAPPAKAEKEQQAETAHISSQVKRGLASYVVSLLFHLALILLAAFIVYHTQDYRWHGEIEGAQGVLGEAGGFELQAPIQFELQQPTSQIQSTDALVTGNLGQGFGESSGKGGVGFFGTRAKGKSFAFVVDISGSMTSPLPHPPHRPSRNRREPPPEPVSRWQKARQEIMSAVDAMTENQSFTVMLYNDSHHAFTRNGEPVGMMRATQRNKDGVRQWLEQINAVGGTLPQLSMHEALKLKPEVLFFLTDGIIPAETRDTAQNSNIGDTVIHTTCIGSPENTILQLIANDHGGRFRSVGGNDFETGSEGIALVCFVSSETENRLKFKRIEDDIDSFQDKLADPDFVLRDDDSHSRLILHNAVSDLPKFTLELQRLIKELNAETRAGYDMQIGSGCLGVEVPLDDLGLRYSDSSIEAISRRKLSIRSLLETSVPADMMNSSQAVKTIYVFGDLDAKREVLASLEVLNLYNGSVVKLIDGEEFMRKQR